MIKIKMIRHEGGSRVLTVSDIIPEDWIAVETKVTKRINGAITVKIEKVK